MKDEEASRSRRPNPSSFIPHPYDSLLLLSFGGPEGPEDVLPFLENVLRGRNVPRARMLEVAEHYYLFGGTSPINAQNRALLAALVQEMNTHGPQLAVYWGNRNWHPLLADVLRQMADDGCRRALAFVTSAFGSYSGCRQYLEDIEHARAEVGPDAPQVDKLRLFFNHPGFIEPMAERVRAALDSLPADRRDGARLIFTAHSVPLWMARSGPYERQLREACGLVAQRVGRAEWDLAYQSRSGPPGQPWLEPDIGDHLRQLHETSELVKERGQAPGRTHDSRGKPVTARSQSPFFHKLSKVRDVVLAPIGFLSEHMEVLYDLDVEAAELCAELGLGYVRSAPVGAHPRLVRMICELAEERLDRSAPRLALGELGPAPDVCPADCCRPPSRPDALPT